MAITELIKSAVPTDILNLLRRLMRSQPLKKFYLVGGTSLALRLGHRMSLDVDLFTHDDFDEMQLAEICHIRNMGVRSLNRFLLHDLYLLPGL